MNIAASIEIAYTDMLRENGELGADVTLRPFQSLIVEPKISRRGQREFPCVDIRASSPFTEDQTTWYCDVSILCKYHNEEDKNHSKLRDTYGAVQAVLDSLFDQQRNDGSVWTDFVANVTSDDHAGDAYSIGGIDYVDAGAPYEEGESINVIPITQRVHFGRC